MSKVAIIGAGAAGLMAAARIVEMGGDHEVFLIERNRELGKKVTISGGGRCNVTTGIRDMKQLLKQYPRGAKFLRTALYAFPPEAMWDWMQAHGVPLKVEEDLRVFPKSNNGKDVVGAFEKFLTGSGVKIWRQCRLLSVERKGEDGAFELRLANRKKDGPGFVEQSLEVDKVILAVGGQAYRHTGSEGDGYSFAEALGHSITPLGPSLNALIVQEQQYGDLAGLSFERVKFRLKGEGKHEFTGPCVFTHKGLSGPAVFALSALASYEEISRDRPVELTLDFFPDLNHDELREKWTGLLKANPRKNVQNVLGFMVPKSFAEKLCHELQIVSSKDHFELSKKETNKLIDALKNLQLTAIGRAAGDEFVTAGGVELSEVDSKSMQSKLVPGLFFAGEILNYDGFTGGFNLQAAWATGRLAGETAAS